MVREAVHLGQDARLTLTGVSFRGSERFYEKVVKVKANVAALLTFLVLCGFRHISAENVALGSLRSDDWQLGRPTASPVLSIFRVFSPPNANLVLFRAVSTRQSLHNRAGNEAKRSSVEQVELRSLVEWFLLFLELARWHPHSASPFWNSASSSFCFGHRTFWICFEPSPPGKLWPTPPHRCHASIRTLNGPLKGPVQVGVRSKYPGPSLS
jgi:hypothetical protein